MTYCEFSKTNPLHRHYHDKEYGFPVQHDDVLLERLALEINQAGLSWDLMLKKRSAFNQAFKKFNIDTVAKMGERDIKRLLADAGIVRNRRKIEAVINNAKAIKALQKQYGSFAKWLDEQAKATKSEKDWVKLFKANFKFVGGEIVKEFLQSIGYLPSPHEAKCPVNKDIFKAKVLSVVCAIPKGQTLAYGEVASLAGNPAAARAVGVLMGQNKDKRIPCHRVVASNSLGGYNGLRGPSKAKILAKERQLVTK